MLRVVSGLFFFPRGGSSHLARSLSRSLGALGDRVTLAVGSLGDPGGRSHAATFFDGIDVVPVDYTPGRGLPFQPSYEDRPDAPDPVFAAEPDDTYERLVRAWSDALGRAGAGEADVLHLHHLTPIHEAALRRFPEVPVVTELHGTELAMLREIDDGASWPYAASWAERMRRWAAGSRTLLVAPGIADEAADRLGVARDRFVELPGGVDLELFDRRAVDRLAFWRRWLVEEPQGWDESGRPGTVRYAEADLRADRRRPAARALRRALHGGEAAAAPPSGACPRAGDRSCSRAARPRRRPPGRVRGRAPAPPRASGRLPRRLARARRPRRRDQRLRPRRPPLAQRGVRARARRGDGLRRAGGRDRLAGAVADRRRRGDRVARTGRRRGRRWRPRSPRPSATRPSAAGAATSRTSAPARATGRPPSRRACTRRSRREAAK